MSWPWKPLLPLALLSSVAALAAQEGGAATRPPVPAASASTPAARATAPASGGRHRIPAPGPPNAAPTPDSAVAWTVVALIILLGAGTALYPIAFYIRTVWASRQQIIFDTLGWRAKDEYLRLYHRSEGARAEPSAVTPPPPAPPVPLSTAARDEMAASDVKAANDAARPGVLARAWAVLSTWMGAGPPGGPAASKTAPVLKPPATPPAPVDHEQRRMEQEANQRFEEMYDRWFGRGRLITPAAIVGAIIACYVLLAAIPAAQILLPRAQWPARIEVGPVVLASLTGAYILTTLDTIDRVTRRDLLPDDLSLSALRLAAAVPLGCAFAQIAQPPAAPFIALAITAIPLREVADLLRRLGYQRLGVTPRADAPTLDAPSRLSGVDRAVCDRLSTIGVDTITQLAYSDPVQLTMRTSLNFVFVLDVVSQALAWVYLESRLDVLRPMGLRGAFELCALAAECADAGSSRYAGANALLDQLPTALGLTPEQVRNALHQITDDPRARFLVLAYS